jgi:hypothetical protein
VDELIRLIFGNVDERILTIIIINGFLIYYLYFYNSKIWKILSDFDKLFFSIVCGWAVYLGLIFPLTSISSQFTFLIDSVETTEISGDEIWAVYKLFTICIVSILLIIRLLVSDKSIYDNIKTFKNIFLAGLFLLFAVVIICAGFYLIMLFSPFKEYANQFVANIIPSLLFGILFLILYFMIHKKILWITLKYIPKKILSKFSNSKIPMVIMLFLVLILAIYCTSEILLDYDYSVTDEHIQNVTIKEVDIQRYNVESANEVILRNYSVEMPRLFKWAKIKPELPIQNKSTLDYTVNVKENAIFVNKKSNVVNFTVTLYNETEISYPKIVTFNESSFSNDSMFINISLNNYLPYYLLIEYLAIPIPANYSLEENDFKKAQIFGNGCGGMQGSTIKEEVLYLTNVHLEKNTSGTITLELFNQSSFGDTTNT